MNTMSEAIARKIDEKAADIRDFVRMGWTWDEAVAEVRRSSTLGPKSWEAVLVKAQG